MGEWETLTCLYAERLIFLERERHGTREEVTEGVKSPKKVGGCGVQVEEGRGGQKNDVNWPSGWTYRASLLRNVPEDCWAWLHAC